MAQPLTALPIGLLDGVNTGISVAAGDRVLLQGQILSGVVAGLYEVPIHVYAQLIDTATGATATIVFETSSNGSSWTTWWSYAWSALAGLTGATQKLGALKVPYFRARLSALAGTAPVVKAYVVRGGG
jgi:hypothetical protein